MKPKRIQRQRTRGWRMPEGTIYVGRPTKWGNPFKVVQPHVCETCGQATHDGIDAQTAVREFRFFLEHPRNLHGHEMPSVEAIQRELRGHDLACWCRLDQPCHADVLLELANA